MFDIVILNGSVLDGSGAAARRLDVGVKNGKIVALGSLEDAEAGEVIDAAGKTVCPGFLDLHRHADAALFREGYGDCDLFQGVTTIGNGNCGLSLAPQAGPYREAIGAYLKPVTGDFSGIPVDTFADYMAALRARPLPDHRGGGERGHRRQDRLRQDHHRGPDPQDLQRARRDPVRGRQGRERYLHPVPPGGLRLRKRPFV